MFGLDDDFGAKIEGGELWKLEKRQIT